MTYSFYDAHFFRIEESKIFAIHGRHILERVGVYKYIRITDRLFYKPRNWVTVLGPLLLFRNHCYISAYFFACYR